jgi:biotin carboxyl carrier protein
MSIYQIVIGNNSYRVDISDRRLLIDGEEEQIHLIPLNNSGLYLLRRGSQTIELQIQTYGKKLYEVTSEGGRRLMAKVERILGNARQAVVEDAHAGDLLAPMCGRVMACHVRVGDTVTQGQALVTVESMKMQMELRAPAAGVVRQVAVLAGAAVEKGEMLVRVEG